MAVAHPAASQNAAESTALAQIVRRGMLEAPNGFLRIRGRRLAAGAYAVAMPLGHGLFTCRLVDSSDDVYFVWELTCRSKPHRESTSDLAKFVKPVVSANLPKVLDHFSQDDDSIGDLTLGWQHAHADGSAVYVVVSNIWKTGHDARGAFSIASGSYYVVHISSMAERSSLPH